MAVTMPSPCNESPANLKDPSLTMRAYEQASALRTRESEKGTRSVYPL